MIYRVGFEKIGILNYDEILKSIDVVTKRHHCDFMIVGATARDLNFELVYDYNEEYRATRDIDIGIAISDWDKFDLIVRDLVDLMERSDYDYLKAGAQVLARKIKNILSDSPVIQGKIDKIIGSETVDIGTSELARIPGYNSNVVKNFALLKAFRDELII